MADNSLRGLAKAYFNGDYEWETYLQQRSQLIDKITEAPIVGKQSSTPIVKYAIFAGMIVVVIGGALGVFWVLKEPELVKPKEVSVPLSEESERQAATPDTEMLADAPDVVAEQEPQTVPLEEAPFYEPDPQEESAGSLDEPPPSDPAQQEESAGSLDEDANTDIEAPTVESEPQVVETKAPVPLEHQNTPDVLTEQDKAKIVELLRECKKHLKADRLVTGNGGTALVCYKDILAIESDNAEALDGLKAIEQRYETWAERALNKNRFSKVKKYLARLEEVNPDSPALADLKQRLEQAER